MQEKNISNPNFYSSKKLKIISIVGLMGVGKTTLGHKLAKKLQLYFVDSDLEIEERTRLSINKIFTSKGEKFFRQIESEIISELIERDEDMVLSLGGGAFINEQTRQLLLERTLVVWLHAPIEEILYRVSGKISRPLLNGQNRRKILEDLIKKRYPIYKEAHLHFDNSKNSYEEIINQIEARYNKAH